MDLLKGLSLFSGIGGIDVALSEFVQTVAYCEIEPYCQSVLLQRMQEGYLPKAPIWDDIRTLPYGDLPRIDIIFGGFPCQGFSVAGLGKGLADERTGLFSEMLRLIKEIKPKWIFLENVPGITSRGGTGMVREITSLGYDSRWCVISAASVGALHKRERWFFLANSMPSRLEVSRTEELKKKSIEYFCKNDSNTQSIQGQQPDMQAMPLCCGGQTWGNNARVYWPFESRTHWQEVVSDVCRVTDGVPRGMDRLKALGNSVVPQQVRKAFMILTGLHETTRKDQ